MVDLNRATLAVVTEALPEDAAEALERAYNHAAFPTVYDDPDRADRYRPAYEEVADRIAALYAAREDAGTGFDPQRWRADREQRNRIEVLDFERQELNAKALRQLREVLTDEQEARLRLPSEVADDVG